MTEKFLIDSNSFIAPYRFYYAFDLVPSYWDKLYEAADSGRIILLDMVRNEIAAGQDELSDWLRTKDKFIICNHVSAEIVAKYQEVIQYVQNCGFYKQSALDTWARASVADPWLIAAAAANHYTLITSEVSSSGLSKKNPNKNAKIPDVAKAFGVKTQDLYYMMRELGIKI